MKKFFAVLMVLSVMLTMTACDLNKNGANDLVEIFGFGGAGGNSGGIEFETPELPGDIEALISSVKVDDGDGSKYDRDQYTSDYQSYTCDKSHDCEKEYNSIRKYSFYECEWYDFDTGLYVDPYNGETTDTIKGMDYDHIIPLAYADAHGGYEWTEEQKRAYADDPFVGVCVNAHDNRAKGAKGPSEWLPNVNVEDYCYTWLVIAEHYGLSIAQEDMDVIKSCLAGVDAKSLSLINDYG